MMLRCAGSIRTSVVLGFPRNRGRVSFKSRQLGFDGRPVGLFPGNGRRRVEIELADGAPILEADHGLVGNDAGIAGAGTQAEIVIGILVVEAHAEPDSHVWKDFHAPGDTVKQGGLGIEMAVRADFSGEFLAASQIWRDLPRDPREESALP